MHQPDLDSIEDTGNLKLSKEQQKAITSMTRFINKEIVPNIEEFAKHSPSAHQIAEHPLRTHADEEFFCHTIDSTNEFKKYTKERVKAYMGKALRGLEKDDSERQSVVEIVDEALERAFEKISIIGLAAEQRYENFISPTADYLEDEEPNEIEVVIAEARDKFRTPVTELIAKGQKLSKRRERRAA